MAAPKVVDAPSDIVLTGLGLRLPGDVGTPEELWQLLQEGKCAIGEVPADRKWDGKLWATGGETEEGKTVTSKGGFIKDIDHFDPAFFSISPKEAAAMDPQQRIGLQLAYEAIRNAHLTPEQLQGAGTGVFVGATFAEHFSMGLMHPETQTNQWVAGNTIGNIANRISFCFNFQGPSFTVDTACASTMTAFHQACSALRRGECDNAVVLGISALLGPGVFVGFSQAHMLSPTGNSLPFDERANGFVRAEGCGCVVLQRADSPALSPKRLGKVLGSGVNVNGTTSSITYPSSEAQAALIDRVYKDYGVRRDDVVFMEAHGTGTQAGDPTELSGIGKAFMTRKDPLHVGSVKANVGHLESAAGAAGLAKALLMLRHRQIPAQANLRTINPKIDLDTLRLRIAREALPFPDTAGLPCVGVNSFGFGGANGHVVIEAPPEGEGAEPTVHEGDLIALPLAAHYKGGCEKWLPKFESLDVNSLLLHAATADHAAGRNRVVLVGPAGQNFWTESERVEGEATTRKGKALRVGLVFGGQGSHHASMGAGLHARFPAFRDAVSDFDAAYRKVSGTSLVSDLGFCTRPMGQDALARPSVAVPCIVAVQYALVCLLRSFGIEPAAVMGHSIGEMCAAYAAGALDLEGLAQLTFARTTAQDKMPEGAMAAFGKTPEEAREIAAALGVELDVAAVNEAGSVTVSGTPAAVAKLQDWAKENKAYFIKLPISRAYHSRQTESVRGVFEDLAKGVEGRPAALPFVSTVEAAVREAPLGADYFWGNIRNTVNFSGGLGVMNELCDVFVEVGPHSVLRQYIQSVPEAVYTHTLRRGKDEPREFLKALAALYCKGAAPAWQGQGAPWDYSVDLPLLPWNNQPLRMGKFAEGPALPGAAAQGAAGAPRASGFNMVLDRPGWGYVHDHVIKGAAVVPGAVYVSVGLELPEGKGASVADMEFRRMLTWPKQDEGLEITTLFDGEVFSIMKGGVLHSRGRRVTAAAPAPLDEGGYAAAAKRCTVAVDPQSVYRAWAKHSGYDFGPRLQTVSSYFVGDAERVFTIKPPPDRLRRFHALPLDTCFQALAYVPGLSADPIVPTSVDLIVITTESGEVPAEPLRAHLKVTSRSLDAITCDMDVFREAGERVAAIRGFTMSAATRSSDQALQLLGVRTQTRVFPDLPEAAAAALVAAASLEERAAAVALCVEQAVQQGRVVRVLATPELAAAARADRPALFEPGCGAAWHTAAEPGPEHTGFDMVCCGGSAAAVQGALSEGGYGIDSEGAVLRGVSTPLKTPRRCLVLGSDPSVASLPSDPEDPEVVIDCRGSLSGASQLVSKYAAKREGAPALVFLVARAPQLLGFCRTARNEFPHLAVVAVEQTPENVERVLWARELGDCELLEGSRVPRLWEVARGAGERAAAGGADYRLQIERPGQLQTLGFCAVDCQSEGLAADEVRVRTRGVAVNFKDIALAMNMLQGYQPIFGLECSGHVEAIGPAAAKESGLKIGDAVVCDHLAPQSLRDSLMGSVAVVKHRRVFRAPKGVDLVKAAGFPLVTATAYGGLVQLANLRKGETVLIHSALGGVGQAAVQIARRAGAVVIGSAGTAEKRRRLTEELGCALAIDSRDSTCFVREVMQFTGGKGVDVVLNSLAGQALLESVRCLAPGGRFVEVGKVDITQNSPLRMGMLRDNITFYSFHTDLLDRTHPERLRALFCECFALLESGELSLPETEVVPFAGAAEAFQKISKGQHSGKIVLEVTPGWIPDGLRPALSVFKSTASYLFTGATRGVGLHVAAWAVTQGARHVILTGSTGRAPRYSLQLLEGLKRQYPDFSYTLLKLDLADPRAVAQVFADHPDCRGVFHFAAQYTAEPSDKVSDKDVAEGYTVKAEGARVLDEATRGVELDHFFMASSVIAMSGSTNQTVYSAANGYTQWLAEDRRRRGLPGVAMDLPAMLGAGRLSQYEYGVELDILCGKGLSPVSVWDVCLNIGRVLADPARYPPHLALECPANWTKGMANIWKDRRFYEHLLPAQKARKAGKKQVAERDPKQMVAAKLCFLLGTSEGDLDLQSPLTDIGVDSLAAVELMNWCNSEFGVAVPQTELLSGMSATELAERLPALAADGEGSDDDDDEGGAADPAAVADAVAAKVAFLLGTKPEEVEGAAPLTDLGVDSLAAVELMNWSNAEFGVAIPQTDLLSGMTVQELSARLAAEGSRSAGKPKREKPAKEAKQATATAPAAGAPAPAEAESGSAVLSFALDGSELDGRPVVPLSAQLAAVWRAFAEREGRPLAACSITDVQVRRPLSPPTPDSTHAEARLRISPAGRWALALPGGDCATEGAVRWAAAEPAPAPAPGAGGVLLERDDVYALLRAAGHHCPEPARTLTTVDTAGGATVRWSGDHAGLLEAALQALLAVTAELYAAETVPVPAAVGAVELRPVALEPGLEMALSVGGGRAADAAGLLRVEGMRLRLAPRRSLSPNDTVHTRSPVTLPLGPSHGSSAEDALLCAAALAADNAADPLGMRVCHAGAEAGEVRRLLRALEPRIPAAYFAAPAPGAPPPQLPAFAGYSAGDWDPAEAFAGKAEYDIVMAADISVTHAAALPRALGHLCAAAREGGFVLVHERQGAAGAVRAALEGCGAELLLQRTYGGTEEAPHGAVYLARRPASQRPSASPVSLAAAGWSHGEVVAPLLRAAAEGRGVVLKGAAAPEARGLEAAVRSFRRERGAAHVSAAFDSDANPSGLAFSLAQGGKPCVRTVRPATLAPHTELAAVASLGEDMRLRFRADPAACYLLHGGLGGFGLQMARWLAARGARHIVATSRSGLRTAEQKYHAAALRAAGCELTVSTLDVTNMADCERLVAELPAPLGGVFLLATLMKEARLADAAPGDWDAVVRTKLAAARNLDLATRSCPTLRHFVCWSSAGVFLGTAGMASYAYANAALDGVCEERRAVGLPALAVQWGTIGDVGLIAKGMIGANTVRGGVLAVRGSGLVVQPAHSCLASLERLLLSAPESAVVSNFVARSALADDLPPAADEGPEAPGAGETAPRPAVVEDAPIAITGHACRYPGDVNSPEDMWKMLVEGRCAVGEVPADRHWHKEWVSPDGEVREGQTVTSRGGFIDVDKFDSPFFEISRNEGAAMDPQQRLALEVSYEAIRAAHLTPAQLARGRCGVFVGVVSSDHFAMGLEHPETATRHFSPGNTLGNIANRVSFCLNFTGPSFAVDTACSSTIMAFHQAMRAMQSGDCDSALVIGVNALLSVGYFVGASQAGLLSPTGTSLPFDERANGYVRAEGCGAVLLQRADSPSVSPRKLAWVRGSGINDDGRTGSLTFPSAEAQTSLMDEVLRRARVSPDDVVYFEAHGTGTQAGDPTECGALSRTFRSRRSPLPIGSVKGNVGHMEGASGASSLTKCLLMMRHRTVVPVAGLRKLNPRIDFDGMGLAVADAVREAPELATGVVGINSFGFGGANGCVLLQAAETPEEGPGVPEGAAVVLPLALHYPEGLGEWAQGFEKAGLDAMLAQACNGDHSGKHRMALVGPAGPRFFEECERVEGESQVPRLMRQKGRKDRFLRVGFAFGGQGSSHPAMARKLYERFPSFRAAIDEFDTLFERHSGRSLRTGYGFCGASNMQRELMSDVLCAVPCTMALQVGLVHLMRAFGVDPSAVVGHSTGEMVAAYAAGAVTLDGLARLVHARSAAYHAMPEGAMAAVGLSADETRGAAARLGLEVDVSATNSAQSVSLSGSPAAIDAFGKWAQANKVFFIRLPIPRAYHSRYTDLVKSVFLEKLGDYEGASARTPYVSAVEARVRSEELDAAYWWSNLRQPVDFAGAIKAMEPLCDVVIEISPHSVLRQYVEDSGISPLYLPTLRRGKDEARDIAKALATLFVNGSAVRWGECGQPRSWDVDCPALPWRHEALRTGIFLTGWPAPGAAAPAAAPTTPVPQQVAAAPAAPAHAAGFNMVLAGSQWSYVYDHWLKGAIVVPGAMVMALALELPEASRRSVVDMEFQRMLTWPAEAETLELTTYFDGEAFSVTREGVLRNKGQRAHRPVPALLEPQGMAAAEGRCTGPVDPAAVYRLWDKHYGLHLGPSFRRVEAVSLGDDEIVATIKAPPDSLRLFHPTVLDSCFQAVLCRVGLSTEIYIPAKLDQLTVLTESGKVPCEPLRIHGVLREKSVGHWRCDIDCFSTVSDPGRRVAVVRGLTAGQASRSLAPEMRLLTVARQTRAFPGLPQGTLPEEVAAGERAAALRGALRAALQGGGRVLRVLASREVADAVRAADPALMEPGRIAWKFADTADPREHKDYDFVCTGGAPAAVRRCLAEGGYGLPEGGSVVRGAAADGAVRRCLVIGEDSVVSAIAEKYPDRVGKNIKDPEMVIDCRGKMAAGSELIKEHGQRKPAPVLVFLARRAPQMWGFTRVARNEFPNLSIVCVEQEVALLEKLVRSTTFDDGELYAGDMVPRIVDVSTESAEASSAAPQADYRLQIERPGQLQTLGFHAVDVASEGVAPDEVRIRTKGVSLHFRDVMIAMNMLQGFQPVFGIECSGVVTEMGSEAAKQSTVRVGDEVLAMSLTGVESRTQRESSMGSTAVVKASSVVPAPKGVDLTVAAGFLGVMVTAYQSLVKLARVEKGDVVLVHSATGGVGQAAIQLAKRAGAVVIGSAGTAEKRRRLTEELGCALAIDSHDPSCFVREVTAFTEGRGCDVVLNSLSGAGQAEGLRCLAPGGRFVEIGKYDILENSALRQRVLKNNISFFSFHLDLLADTHPRKVAELFAEVTALLAKGEIRPVETEVVPFANAQDAFQRMSKGLHQGKLVLGVEEGWVPPAPKPSRAIFRRTASYLFTGATRGVGLHMAAWAVTQGARRIILTGASGRLPRLSALALDHLKASTPELKVTVMKLDLADAAAVRAVFDAHPDIRGVFHLATQYTAQSADKVDARSVAEGYAAKAEGARHLHEATSKRQVDIFFMAASTAGLFGNQNQAVYAAANGYLQWLATHRRRMGLPAVAVDLPVMLGAGRLSEFQNAMELEIITGKGWKPMSVQDVSQVIGQILAEPNRYPAHVTLESPGWAAAAPTVSRYARLFEHHAEPRRARRGAKGQPRDVRQLVAAKLAFLLGGVQAADIDMDAALTELGVDSLAAVELMNWCNSEFGVSIAQTELLSGITAADLVEMLPATADPADGAEGDGEEQETLSADEITDMVSKKLLFLLGNSVEQGLDTTAALTELGVDSLAAVELMNWCNSEFGVSVAQTELLSGISVLDLVDRLVNEQQAAARKPAPPQQRAAPAAAVAAAAPAEAQPAAAPAPAAAAPAGAAPAAAPAGGEVVGSASALELQRSLQEQMQQQMAAMQAALLQRVSEAVAQQPAPAPAPPREPEPRPEEVATPSPLPVIAARPRERPAIRITGLACRLPGRVNSPEELWSMLLDARCGISEVPADRAWDPRDWLCDGYDDLRPGKAVTNRMGSIDVDHFDPPFFGYSPKEAPALCPMHRNSLEVAYECIRNAHLTPEILSAPGRSTGVFVAATASEHLAMGLEYPETMTMHTMPGNTVGNIANRVSFNFNFMGPSFACDTACSSVVTAMHLAVLSLQAGNCDSAIVIGTGAHLGVGAFVGFSQAHMLSPTGTSRPFDAAANGFVRAEGFGAILLQREDCPALSPRTWAMLRGTGINVQGMQESITRPAKGPQRMLIEQVMQESGVSRDDVVFIEAHGTGTQAGDPTECAAIGEVFGQTRAQPIPIGSVKGNVGHLETCSGLPGIAKALLMIRHKKLVPTAGFDTPNPKIDFEHLNLWVPREVSEMPELGTGLVSLNSFGFGGANGHVIMQAPTPEERRGSAADPVPEGELIALPVCLHFREGLESYVDSFRGKPVDTMLAHAVAGDHAAGRFRKVLVGPAGPRFWAEAEVVEGEAKTGSSRQRATGSQKVVSAGWVFGGEGGRHAEMGAALFRRFAPFRDAVLEFDEHYRKFSGVSLMRDHGLCGPAPMRDSSLADGEVTLPCELAVQVGLIHLLRSFGVAPAAVAGHSNGETAAAYAAGVVSMEDLCRFVHARTKALRAMPSGAMAAVGRSEEQMRAAIAELGLGEDLDIAAVNAPQSVTVSGRAPAVEKVREWCAKGEVYFKMLDIPRAYHSRFTAPCRDAFLESFRAVRPKSAAVPFFSTVEGKQRTAPLDATYWWSNISSAVRFWPALQAMQEKCAVVMEVSAHSVLRQYCLEHEKLPYVHCLRRGKDDVSEFLKSLAFVFCKGVQVSWEGAGRPRDWNVDVPPMPWNNKPFRIGKFAEDVTTRYSGGPLASSAAPAAAVAAPATASDKYTMTLHRNTYGYVHHHVVKGAVVVPGAMYISLGLELPEGKGASVCDMEFRRMLTWSKADETLEITMLYDGESFSVMKGGVLHAKGRRALRPHPAPIDEGGLAAAERRCTTAVDPAAIYRTCAKFVDFDLDRRFQTVAAYYVGDGERLVHIPAPEDDLRLFHPAVMDACFQGLGYVTGISADPIVPTSLGQLTVLTDTGRMPHEPLRCHVRVKSRTPDSLTADIDVFTVPGVRVAAVRDFTMSAAARSSDPSLQLITVRRQPRRLPDLPVPELPEGAADEERHAALAAAARAAVDSGRVVRVLSSAGALAAAKAADPALLEPGRAVWHTAPAGGDYDLVCTEADEAAVRACLAPGGYGLLQGGGVVRGAAAEGAVRRCKVLGADPALAELAAAHPGQVGPEVADPEIVFDARGDLVAASALIRDYARKDAAPALAFVVRDAPELWGFTRCARNEFPGLSIVAVESDAAAISAAARLTAFPDCELYAGGAVPRITNAVPAPAPEDDPASAGDYRVQIDRVGQLNTLGYARIDRAQEGCGADEVRLDVRAVGVNFKDVVVAMGLLSGFSPVFGLECAGVVSALGEQAARQSGLKVGDAVLAACFTPAGARDSLMGTTAVAKWHNVVPAPKGVDLAAAAGFPLVMATAYQSLTKLAQLESDETVLIHSATGGVGQAAIQLAKRAGAKVIGSAGTPEKRKRLVEELGCDHAIDSHDPTCFVKEVMAFTEGRGCDVVLNSLSGAAQAESMRCLAPGGRFVEIGKVDMQQNSVIRQGLLQQNISFFSFHLDLLGRTHPAKAQRMLREVVQLLEKGELRPVETEVAPLSAAASVLQRMSRGEHQGKIVLQVEEGWAPERPRPSAAIFRRDASYLFTGATRGVGLHAAAWAVQQGARRIILTGSTGRAPRHSELLLRGLRQRVPDLEYRVLKLDLADPAAVSALFEAEPSIRGVFHFATQYTSETSDSVTTDTVRGGLAVKAHGAKALHEATKGRDIDIFFMASSLAGLVGNQNQAMYSAANGYLQWLAAERRRLGLPGVALDLPAIIGAGRLSEFEHAMELEILVGKGTVPVSVHDVTAFMGTILANPLRYPAHLSLDGPGWAAAAKGVSRYSRLYEHHVVAKRSRRAGGGGGGPVDAPKVVREKLAAVLGSKESDVDMGSPLTDTGVDSLAAVELMNWINSEFGVSIPQSELLGGLTGDQLAAKLPSAGGGGGGGDEEEEGGAGPQDPAQVAAAVRSKVAQLLGSKESDVPTDTPMTDMGVDSLAAVELMNWCNSEYGVSVPQSDLLSGMTLDGLAVRLAQGA